MGKRAFVAIALLAMAILTLSCGVQAEETEELQADNGTAEEKSVRYMFVQNAQSGTLVPVAGEDSLYTLTLMGIAPQTIAFSDRPPCLSTIAWTVI
jgi:outer membrane lipoprotein-sorting protein